MHTIRTSRALSTTAAVALAITAFSAAPAFADAAGSSGHSVLRAQLVGSTPAGPVVAGVKPGGAPWVNGPSPARVRDDGRITVTLRGLVIPPPRGNNTSPVNSVFATLVCENTLQGSTAPFALSAEGNGQTSDVISVPRHCEDPAVLIRITANPGAYIASAFAGKD